MWDSGTAISARQERIGGYSCTPARLLASFNVWYHISAPNPLGIFPSIPDCCDTSGKKKKERKKSSTKVSGLLIHCVAVAYPANASAFLKSTWRRWRSRFHLVNHLVQVLNPPPFIISWQGDGGKM